ncbi:hypothetical protein [Tomitella biformata]|uniref:hypothetical protein n=1 Tax=Tomitella biformata TaxID=630403 RepID=UPI000464BDDE|nr:hypothetical protein [Tomitella biformata]
MSEVLYTEPGARWRVLLLAPIFAVVGLVSDALLGSGMRWFVWVLAALILGAIGSWMVHAARQHTSVSLTREVLVQGQDELPTSDIVKVFPAAPRNRTRDDPAEHWESARALGEISRIPRGRRGVGIQLRRGNLTQAWAKDDDALRTALQAILDARRKGSRPT